MKKLLIVIAGLHVIFTYPMENQTNDQISSKLGSFSVNYFSIKINHKRRFQVNQFRTIVDNIDLSFLSYDQKEDEPDAFIHALEFLPTCFCQEDECMVTREVVRTLLMHPEIRCDNTHALTIDTWLQRYFSLLINEKKYSKYNLIEPIKIVLSGIPNTLPDWQLWSRHIDTIINTQVEKYFN